jgi:DNA-binding response OmpR family regulator
MADPEKKTVLVVEDDQAIREAAVWALEKNGYGVIQAKDGEEGLGKVEAADIVLLDIFMPKVSGEEFLATLRNQGNYVPVIIMSAAFDREEGLRKFGKQGIVDFIPKPFTMSTLVDHVGKAAGVVDDLAYMSKATDRLRGFIARQARA